MNGQKKELPREESEDRFKFVSNSTEGTNLVYKAKFTPTTKDQGLYLGCRAEQFDFENATFKVETKVKIQVGLKFLKLILFLQKIENPLDIKFSPRLSKPMETNDDVISLIFDGNPLPSNVSLTMEQICENNNETCPMINLQEGENGVADVTIKNVMSDHVQNDKRDHLLRFNGTKIEITVLNPEKLENSTISVSVSNGIGLPLELNIKQTFKAVYSVSFNAIKA